MLLNYKVLNYKFGDEDNHPAGSEENEDNYANQLNPNSETYEKSRQ